MFPAGASSWRAVQPHVVEQVRDVVRHPAHVVGEEEDAEADQEQPGDELHGPQPVPGPRQPTGQPAEDQADQHEGHSQAERVREQQHHPAGQGPGAARQPEDHAEHRSDARRPGEGERHPHERRRPDTELGRPHVEAMLAGHSGHDAQRAGAGMGPHATAAR